MYKVRHNRFYLSFVISYFRILMSLHFRGIRVTGEPESEKRSVLLLQNHFSWWDGYWSLLISKKIFRKRFHIMMLEEELKKRMFLNRCGAFSVKKNGREVLESIDYTIELLGSSDNLVTIYPQGEIVSLNSHEFRFGKGAEWILKRLHEGVAVWFAVILIDYFSQPRPLVSVYLRNHYGDTSTEKLGKAYGDFFRECVTKQIPG